MKIDRTVRVELTHEDIEQAIREYLSRQISDIRECRLDIFDSGEAVAVGNKRTPLFSLEAFAEIELIPQPAYRAEVPGDKNPLPLKVESVIGRAFPPFEDLPGE